MTKVYYFYDKETERCFFFENMEYTDFYRDLLRNYNEINTLKIECNNFIGSDVFYDESFRDLLLEEVNENIYDTEDCSNIKKLITQLDIKIRNKKLDNLLT